MTILLMLALWLGYELLAWSVRTVTRREQQERDQRNLNDALRKMGAEVRE